MWKNRLGYILLIAGCFVLLFFYGIPFLIYAAVLLLAAAAVAALFLRRDSKYIKTDFKIFYSGREHIRPVVEVQTDRHLLSAGYILAEVDVRNEMFDTTESRRLWLKIQGKTTTFEVPVETDKCGEVSIKCKKTQVYDIFKLFCFPCRGFEEVRTVIYPHKVRVKVEITRNYTGIPQEEGMVQNRKGNDHSEIYDIREYMPGDDIRSIHWKLSSKTDNLILKEASDPSHYHVMILPDFGLDREDSGDEINTAVGIGAAVARQMVRRGIPFCMALPTKDGLKLQEITGRRDYQRMMSQWLGLKIQKKSGDGLRYFNMGHMEQSITRLFILSAGRYEENLSSLDGRIGITVLDCNAGTEGISVSKNGTCEIIELPAGKTDAVYRIIC